MLAKTVAYEMSARKEVMVRAAAAAVVELNVVVVDVVAEFVVVQRRRRQRLQQRRHDDPNQELKGQEKDSNDREIRASKVKEEVKKRDENVKEERRVNL